MDKKELFICECNSIEHRIEQPASIAEVFNRKTDKGIFAKITTVIITVVIFIND